jgi:hypothetical protein
MTHTTTNVGKKRQVGKMAYKTTTMKKLENLREELLRIKESKEYFALTDAAFSRLIGLSTTGYVKIMRGEVTHTQSATIAAIAHNLDMSYEIKEEKGKTYVYFTKKEIEIDVRDNVILDNELVELFLQLNEDQRQTFIRLARFMDAEVHAIVDALLKKLEVDKKKEG